MTYTRHWIYVTVGVIEEYSSLDELISVINQAKIRSYNEGIQDIKVDINTETGYYGSVSVMINLEGRRLETDEEFALRVAAMEAQHTVQEQSEYATWQKLNRKFGAKN